MPRLQRVDGAARISVRSAPDGHSRIADLYQRAPARMLFPELPANEPPMAVLVNTSGGLTGGDRISVAVRADADASITITGQAAEKIYLCEDTDCVVRARIDVAAGASVEWLTQETILFDGARLDRLVEADVAPTGRLLAIESIILGRGAMGEVFSHGRLRDAWRISREGRPLWIDALALEHVAAERAAPFGLGDATSAATVLLVARDADRSREGVRSLVAESGVRGGASAFDGLLIVRLLDPDPARLRAIVMTLGAKLRGTAMPRVWSC
jgi:urease accessory protein